MKQVSDDFQKFMEESNGAGPAFMEFVMKLSNASALDAKTHELAYLAVLSALQMTGGIPYHAKQAKETGASLEEVKSAVLVSMPLVGLRVSESLAAAIESYEMTD
jgi:alkylhydroperoxidase/carboxymuconolactone decarboxylase family protein YurZ